MKRTILSTAALACALAWTLLLPASSWADDKNKDKDDEPLLLEGQKQTLKAPPILINSPSDSWRFVDLVKLKQKEDKAGKDTSGYATLRFRLWNASKRANIYVWAWVDTMERDQTPLTLEALIAHKLESLKKVFKEPKTTKPKAVRFGKRPGAGFEIQGSMPGRAQPHAIVANMAYRPEDKCVLLIQLECQPSQLKKLKKDLGKLQKKLRF